MTESTCDPEDDSNEELALKTRIDGEEVRLLVHIEPIDDTEANARTGEQPPPMGE